MSTDKKELGKQGEDAVASYLRHKGFSICAQNYSTAQGEVDIIACTAELMIFVEVKLRKRSYFNLSTVITQTKQNKIIKAALHYIFMRNIQDMSYRFDVALVQIDHTVYSIQYIQDAFTARECYL